MEKKKEYISYLKQISNNYFTAVVLITTGVFGLFFANISFMKMIILFLLGSFFDLIYFIKYIKTNKLIKRIIREMK